jgi:hypothetical protein
MKESYEDIQKLLEQFTSGQDAGQMTDDIRQADSLLASVPAVKVSDNTLAAIHARVQKHLTSRHTHTVRIRIEKYILAVAAMVFIAVLVGVVFNTQTNNGPLPPLASTIWNDSLATDTNLTNQYDQLTGQMDKINQTATQWLEENSNLSVEIENLEAIATNTDFWKG